MNIRHKGNTRARLKRAIDKVRSIYQHCTLCPFMCGANRNAGEIGECRVGNRSKIFNTALLTNEDPAINPTYAIYFAGCNCQCKFCSVQKENRSFTPSDEQKGTVNGSFLEINDALINKMKQEIAEIKPKTISFLGGEPSIHMLSILKLIYRLQSDRPLVFFSNMYYSPVINDILLEFFDYIIADMHYGNDTCAREICGARNYINTVTKNIIETKKKLILRHLLLPGHFQCCYTKIVDWIQKTFSGPTLHLLVDYFPYNEQTNPMKRVLAPHEIQKAVSYAAHRGIAVELLNVLRRSEYNNENPTHTQEITIDEHGKVVFKYMTSDALSAARSLGGHHE